MNPAAAAVEVQLADHGARIRSLEDQTKESREDSKDLGRKLDKLQYWIMGTLAAAALGFLGNVVSLLKR